MVGFFVMSDDRGMLRDETAAHRGQLHLLEIQWSAVTLGFRQIDGIHSVILEHDHAICLSSIEQLDRVLAHPLP